MKRFAARAGRVVVDLTADELAVLSIVPGVLESVGPTETDPAAARLEPAVHRDDAARSEEFRRLSSGIIEGGRRADAAMFADSLDRVAAGESLSVAEGEAWSRVLTHARLILGARIGIDSDSWQPSGHDNEDPRLVVLLALGTMQDQLVRALFASR